MKLEKEDGLLTKWVRLLHCVRKRKKVIVYRCSSMQSNEKIQVIVAHEKRCARKSDAICACARVSRFYCGRSAPIAVQAQMMGLRSARTLPP